MPQRTCPPCHGNCREGRDCPADREDAMIGGRLIVVAVFWGLLAWAWIAACVAVWGMLA